MQRLEEMPRKKNNVCLYLEGFNSLRNGNCRVFFSLHIYLSVVLDDGDISRKLDDICQQSPLY